MKTTTRKPRARQVIPSATRRKELFRMLDRQAENGNVEAAGWLLFLSEPRDTRSAQT